MKKVKSERKKSSFHKKSGEIFGPENEVAQIRCKMNFFFRKHHHIGTYQALGAQSPDRSEKSRILRRFFVKGKALFEKRADNFFSFWSKEAYLTDKKCFFSLVQKKKVVKISRPPTCGPVGRNVGYR